MACAQLSSEPADKVQCLGDMPWRCRATAVQPDAIQVGAKPQKVKGGGREASGHIGYGWCPLSSVPPGVETGPAMATAKLAANVESNSER